MKAATLIIGIALILAGLAGLVTGGFTVTRDTTAAKLGPLELKLEQSRRVDVPPWASAGVMALGVVLVVLGARKR